MLVLWLRRVLPGGRALIGLSTCSLGTIDFLDSTSSRVAARGAHRRKGAAAGGGSSFRGVRAWEALVWAVRRAQKLGVLVPPLPPRGAGGRFHLWLYGGGGGAVARWRGAYKRAGPGGGRRAAWARGAAGAVARAGSRATGSAPVGRARVNARGVSSSGWAANLAGAGPLPLCGK